MARPVEPLKLTLRQIAEATGESIPTLYQAISAGHLDTFLVGRRRFARPAAVREWVNYLESQSKAGRPVIYRPRSSEVGSEAAGDGRG